MLKNGFRFNSGSIPEVSGLERVEYLKGGSALLYGNVAPGGILNLVTKTPQFTKGWRNCYASWELCLLQTID